MFLRSIILGTLAGSSLATPSSSGSATSAAPSASASSAPAAPAGFKNVVIDVTQDTSRNLSFTDEFWKKVDSTCSPGTQAMSIAGNASGFATYDFPRGGLYYSFYGSAIYLSLFSINAEYTINIDGDSTQYGFPQGAHAAPTPANCTVGFSKTGLSGTVHTLFIDMAGPPSETLRDPYEFQVQGFTIVQSDGAESSGIGTESATPSASTTGADGIESGTTGSGEALRPTSWAFLPVAILAALVLSI